MRNLLLGLVVVAGIGCSDFGPDRDLIVQSNEPSFKSGTSAVFTVTNRSRRTHSFWACSAGAPPRPTGKIDRHDPGGWTEIDGFSAFCLGIGVPVQVPLEPGQSLQFGISLGRSAFVGTLRVRLTQDERILGVSNEFTVTN